MISQPVAKIGDVDNDGILCQTGFIKRCHDPADIVVDKGNLAIGIGNDFAQLLICLFRDATIILAYFRSLLRAGRLGCQNRFMPPWPAFE